MGVDGLGEIIQRVGPSQAARLDHRQNPFHEAAADLAIATGGIGAGGIGGGASGPGGIGGASGIGDIQSLLESAKTDPVCPLTLKVKKNLNVPYPPYPPCKTDPVCPRTLKVKKTLNVPYPPPPTPHVPYPPWHFTVPSLSAPTPHGKLLTTLSLPLAGGQPRIRDLRRPHPEGRVRRRDGEAGKRVHRQPLKADQDAGVIVQSAIEQRARGHGEAAGRSALRSHRPKQLSKRGVLQLHRITPQAFRAADVSDWAFRRPSPVH